MIGQMVGQYQITQKLGEGGMGAVYKAVDTMLGREVAIKMLRPEIARQPNLLERFRAEAMTVARLNHAGIATLYSFMQQGQDFFMVMEYVPGKTLEDIERERGAIPWQWAVPLGRKMLEAIQPAHEMGILHRDIKPANIMLTTWGTVKVMDFGIARIVGSARMTSEGRMVGTIEYVPPERVEGKESDARGDIYSFAVMLFEMISHRLPFQSDSEFELMRMHLQQPMPTFAEVGCDVPPQVEAVIRQAMSKSPADRYPSCDAFSDALAAASGNITITKKDVVDLVGPIAVQEMGTAGHTFTPGEVPNLAGPGTNVVVQPGTNVVVQPGTNVVVQPGVIEPATTTVNPSVVARSIDYLKTNWKISAAVAAVIVCITGGVVLGLAGRQDQQQITNTTTNPTNTTTDQQPAVVATQPTSVPTDQVQQQPASYTGGGNVQQQPPPPQPVQLGGVTPGQPAQPVKKPTKPENEDEKRKEALRAKAINALNEQ